MKKNRKIKTRRVSGQFGFTLIELLVVISVISLLASILLVAMNSARQKAYNVRIIADMTQIGKALQAYSTVYGNYPLAEPDIQNHVPGALITAPHTIRWDYSTLDGFIPGLAGEGLTSLQIKAPPGAYYLYIDGQKYTNEAVLNSGSAALGGTCTSMAGPGVAMWFYLQGTQKYLDNPNFKLCEDDAGVPPHKYCMCFKQPKTIFN